MARGFERILEDIIPEANFLTISDTRIEPGALLFSQNNDTYTDTIKSCLVPDFFQANDFQTILAPGEFALESAIGKFSGSAALSLLGFLNIKVGGGREFELEVTVEEVKVRHYASEKMGLISFEKKLREFKEKDRETFNLIKGRFLVFSSFYASQFRLQFAAGSQLGGSVEFDNEKIAVEVGANMQKDNAGVLVSNNNTVPFAVSGYRITRGGRFILEPA